MLNALLVLAAAPQLPRAISCLLLLLFCLLPASCAASGEDVLRDADPRVQRFEAAFRASDWQDAAALAKEIVGAAVAPSHEIGAWHGFYWRMITALEQVGDFRTAMAACVASGDPDAALEFRSLFLNHGIKAGTAVSAEIAAATKATTEGRMLLHVTLRSALENWGGCREAIDQHAMSLARLHGGELRALGEFVLADSLLRADRLEAALAEYVTATWELSSFEVDHPQAAMHRTLGFLRQAQVLATMGHLGLADEALQQAEQQPGVFVDRPRAREVRDLLRGEIERRRAFTRRIMAYHGERQEPAHIWPLEFAKLQGVTAVAGGLSLRQKDFRVADAGLTIEVGDESMVFTTEGDAKAKPISFAFTEVNWNGALGCYEYSAGRGRPCLRRFADGSIYFGPPGFAALGIVLSPHHAPHGGLCHFGRPAAESFVVAEILERRKVEGRMLQGQQQREHFTARMKDGAIFLGEGFCDGERIIPDGQTVLCYGTQGWFESRCEMGTPGEWLRQLNMASKDTLGTLVDLAGKKVAYVPPSRTDDVIAHFRGEERRLAQAEADARVRREAQLRRDREEAAEVLRWHEEWQRQQPAPQLSACEFCNGAGSTYRGGGAEQYRYSVQDQVNGPWREVIGVRHTSGSMVPCRYCDGNGVR